MYDNNESIGDNKHDKPLFITKDGTNLNTEQYIVSSLGTGIFINLSEVW